MLISWYIQFEVKLIFPQAIFVAYKKIDIFFPF